MKKITIATVKSFIRKNRHQLLVCVYSRFDGMVDGEVSTGSRAFYPASPSTLCFKNNLGVAGVWFVGGDYCTPLVEVGLYGFEVSNCCGHWAVAIKEF